MDIGRVVEGKRRKEEEKTARLRQGRGDPQHWVSVSISYAPHNNNEQGITMLDMKYILAIVFLKQERKRTKLVIIILIHLNIF